MTCFRNKKSLKWMKNFGLKGKFQYLREYCQKFFKDTVAKMTQNIFAYPFFQNILSIFSILRSNL